MRRNVCLERERREEGAVPSWKRYRSTARHGREQNLELAGAGEPRGRRLAEWTEMKADLDGQQKFLSCAVCGLK